jgi:hypothetical protein
MNSSVFITDNSCKDDTVVGVKRVKVYEFFKNQTLDGKLVTKADTNLYTKSF